MKCCLTSPSASKRSCFLRPKWRSSTTILGSIGAHDRTRIRRTIHFFMDGWSSKPIGRKCPPLPNRDPAASLQAYVFIDRGSPRFPVQPAPC